MIHAAAEQIWQHLIAATAWSNWYSNAANFLVNDPSDVLADGVSFEWTTFGRGHDLWNVSLKFLCQSSGRSPAIGSPVTT